MKILQQLAGYLARKYRREGVRLAGVAETLTEIRLLLAHEVDFPGEQSTLLNALHAYRSISGVRVPRLIKRLSTATVTALTQERGVKVTECLPRSKILRGRVAQRLAEALVAVPVLGGEEDMIFHADPHAGNVLYDKKRGELVILDWALTAHLTRLQRKWLFMLWLMTMLRNADGMTNAIEHLRLRGSTEDGEPARIIRERVAGLLNEVAWLRLPRPMDAMRLLDRVALDGIRFPAEMLMFRKAWFTLEGVLEDIAGFRVKLDSAITRYAVMHWADTGAALFSLLSPSDWMALDWSVLTLPSRLGAQELFRPWRWVRRLLLQTAQ
jgi:ubiquinone biosynthesis protein